jgi:ribonuclease D
LTLITSSNALNALCKRLALEEFVTVDTEFIRETTYWPKLCLIQIAGAHEAAAIDPLADNLDLTPFYALMTNEKVLKVFHAARQDIEIMYNLGKIIPQPLFDSQIAAQVLGLGDQIGYAELVQTLTTVAIDKGSRHTDWARRPLTNAQIDYALGDVTHLHKIAVILREMLQTKKRLSWMTEELAVLLDPQTYNTDPKIAYERLKHRVKKPKELAVLMALCEWREAEAQRQDVPRGRLLKDDTLTEICQNQPILAESLANLRSIPKGFESSRDGKRIIELVNDALLVDPKSLPAMGRSRGPGAQQRAIIELLRVLLKAISENEGVAARILASSEDLEAISSGADCPALHGWRLEIFGEPAQAMLRGETGLAFVKGRVVAVNL